MIGGAHLLAGHEEGRRSSEVGVLSCDGGGNRAGRRWLVGLLGRWREAMARERVGRRARSGSAGPKSKESFITDLLFLNFNGFQNLARLWKFVQGDLGGIFI
jgi:hypothetical protein